MLPKGSPVWICLQGRQSRTVVQSSQQPLLQAPHLLPIAQLGRDCLPHKDFIIASSADNSQAVIASLMEMGQSCDPCTVPLQRVQAKSGSGPVFLRLAFCPICMQTLEAVGCVPQAPGPKTLPHLVCTQVLAKSLQHWYSPLASLQANCA